MVTQGHFFAMSWGHYVLPMSESNILLHLVFVAMFWGHYVLPI